jgi:hypothetical protein
MNTTTSIQTPETSARRPVIITVLCILGFLAAAGNIPTVFADSARNVGAWYPPFLALSVIVTVVSMIGVWKMHRWAVFLYTGFAVVTQVLVLAMGVWNLTAILVRLAVIIIMFSQIGKMR